MLPTTGKFCHRKVCPLWFRGVSNERSWSLHPCCWWWGLCRRTNCFSLLVVLAANITTKSLVWIEIKEFFSKFFCNFFFHADFKQFGRSSTSEKSMSCEIKQGLLNMLIIHISWCFLNIFLLCECVVNDISYTQRDAIKKPEVWWLKPLRPAWTRSWVVPLLHDGTPTSWQCPCHATWTSLDHWGAIQPPRAASVPAAVLNVIPVKDFVRVCVLQTQLPSGWEQPGFPLLPAFLLLGMQTTSPRDPGTELRKCWWCKSKWDVPEVLYVIWHLQGHRLLNTTCLSPPEDQGVTLEKNILKWYLFLPSPEPPSGSHQSWRCDTSGTRSWVNIWGHIAKLSSGLTKSIIR